MQTQVSVNKLCKNKFAPCLDISNIFIWTFIYSRYVFATLQNVLVHTFFRLRADLGSLIRSFFVVVVLLQWITIFRLIATKNEDSVIENQPKLSFCKTYCAARGWKHFQSCLFRQHTKFNRIIVYIGMEEGSRKQTFISTDFSSKKRENFEWQCIFDSKNS